jgi:hypothetical protein
MILPNMYFTIWYYISIIICVRDQSVSIGISIYSSSW